MAARTWELHRLRNYRENPAFLAALRRESADSPGSEAASDAFGTPATGPRSESVYVTPEEGGNQQRTLFDADVSPIHNASDASYADLRRSPDRSEVKSILPSHLLILVL